MSYISIILIEKIKTNPTNPNSSLYDKLLKNFLNHTCQAMNGEDPLHWKGDMWQ